MPGFVTHYLFGVDAFKRIDEKYIRKNIKNNHNAFSLGLQGPDVFFYYLPSYFLHGQNIGDLAHRKDTGAFFSYLLESRSLFAGNSTKLLIADSYIAGFIGHYTLDCATHPYVYGFTGYDPVKAPKNSEYFGQHAYFETEIDNELLFMKKGLSPSEFRQDGTIMLSPLERHVISKMVTYAYSNTYPAVSVRARHVGQATKWMKLGTKLVHDPSGQKKVLARFVEKIIFDRPFISPMVPSDKYQFVEDCLNDNHRTWIDPWTSEESTASFMELYNDALKLYNERLDAYYALVRDGFTVSKRMEFENSYGCKSFLSGKSLR